MCNWCSPRKLVCIPSVELSVEFSHNDGTSCYNRKCDVTSGYNITCRLTTSVLVGPNTNAFLESGSQPKTFLNHCTRGLIIANSQAGRCGRDQIHAQPLSGLFLCVVAIPTVLYMKIRMTLTECRSIETKTLEITFYRTKCLAKNVLHFSWKVFFAIWNCCRSQSNCLPGSRRPLPTCIPAWMGTESPAPVGLCRTEDRN